MSSRVVGLRSGAESVNGKTPAECLVSYNGYHVRQTYYDSESTGDSVRACPGCGFPMPSARAQRYCRAACYYQSLRSTDTVARFWVKVNKNGPIHFALGTACWDWTANAVGRAGCQHGQFVLPRAHGYQRHIYAHRYSWEQANGPIPDALEVLHRCDRGICVRPDHLFLGTQADNLTDARQKGRLDSRAPRAGKLTYDERVFIYEAPTSRGLVSRLARSYGVTKSTISNIRAGRFAREATVTPQDIIRMQILAARGAR